MASTRKPPVSDTWLIQRGHQALGLAREHTTPIEARLPSGLLDGLETDLAELQTRRAKVKQVRSSAKVATSAQNVARDQAAAVISAIGKVARSKPLLTAEQRKAYGVGIKMQVGKVSSVAGVGTMIVDRATSKPDEARAIGILDADVELLRELVSSLEATDAKQEKLLAGRPRTTADRNRALWRIYEGIKAIAGAGVLAFALDDALRNQFDTLDDLPKKKKKKAA